MLKELNKFLNPIKRKIFLMIGKALLTAVNHEGQTGFYSGGTRATPQRISVNWFGQLTDLEHVQPYGLSYYPIVNTSKAVILSPDGARSNALAIIVQDDEYRPSDLSEGDVCIYGKNDKTNSKHRLLMDANGNIVGLVDSGKTISLGNGTDELLDLFNQTLTEMISLVSSSNLGGSNSVDLTGTASTGTLFKIQANLATIESNLTTIQTNLGNIKA